MNIEGKCEICRQKDRNDSLKKKQAEIKAKKVEELKAMEKENRDFQLAIREFKNEVNLEKAVDGSSDMPAPNVKRPRPLSPQNDPAIKVEADDEPYSYDKLLEVVSSVERKAKRRRQRRGEAAIGEWTPVNSRPLNSKDEEVGEDDSTFTNADSDSHTNTGSGAFTFGNIMILQK